MHCELFTLAKTCRRMDSTRVALSMVVGGEDIVVKTPHAHCVDSGLWICAWVRLKQFKSELNDFFGSVYHDTNIKMFTHIFLPYVVWLVLSGAVELTFGYGPDTEVSRELVAGSFFGVALDQEVNRGWVY